MFQKKTPEEQAREAEIRDQRQQEAEERRRAEQIEKERRAFFKTPAGQARLAYERGDHVFQCSIDVMNQQAIIVAMVGSSTAKKTTDPSEILNSVCREGWDLVSGSFVFIEQGQQSRDKFLSSGQNVAVKGTVAGYYVFRRCSENRAQRVELWQQQVIADARSGRDEVA